MKRRGFLGFLGGAVVAGPSMAKEAALQTTADLRVAGVSLPAISKSVTETGDLLSLNFLKPDPSNVLSDLRNDLEALTSMSVAQRKYRLDRISVSALDPDLAGMRSFSLDTKMRMQRERQLKRDLEAERAYLLKRIAEVTAKLVTS